MQIADLALPDVKLVQLKVHGDSRGFFMESYKDADWRPILGSRSFIQDNQSLSAEAGTVRGLHYQMPPFTQAKLLQVLRGRILDVAVDLRRASPTFGQHVAVELSADNGRALYVPERFAHGYQALEDATETSYMVGEFYTPGVEGGLSPTDPRLGLKWPLPTTEISDKDRAWKLLEEIEPDVKRKMSL